MDKPKSKKIGEIYKTNNYGDIVVLDYNSKNKKYKVQFLDTGSIVDNVDSKSLSVGMVKDRYKKTIYNVGCIGNATKKGNTRAYNVWLHMLERCYNQKCKSYSRYGGKGVTVCDRWHCFEYFLEDLPHVENYNKELFEANKVHLDKDLKQLNVNYKIYSPDTTIFLSAKENSALQDITGKVKKMKVTYPNGDIQLVENISKFAREHGLERSRISECLNRGKNTYKEWKFENYKESV